jgi:hypothetical protein
LIQRNQAIFVQMHAIETAEDVQLAETVTKFSLFQAPLQRST